jgi:hypothetical protein
MSDTYSLRVVYSSDKEKIEELLSLYRPDYIESSSDEELVLKLGWELDQNLIELWIALANNDVRIDVDYEMYSKMNAGRLSFEPGKKSYTRVDVLYPAYRYSCDYIEGDDVQGFLCEVLYGDTPYEELSENIQNYIDALVLKSKEWVTDWDLMCAKNEKEIPYDVTTK